MHERLTGGAVGEAAAELAVEATVAVAGGAVVQVDALAVLAAIVERTARHRLELGSAEGVCSRERQSVGGTIILSELSVRVLRLSCALQLNAAP